MDRETGGVVGSDCAGTKAAGQEAAVSDGGAAQGVRLPENAPVAPGYDSRSLFEIIDPPDPAITRVPGIPRNFTESSVNFVTKGQHIFFSMPSLDGVYSFALLNGLRVLDAWRTDSGAFRAKATNK